MAGEAPGLHQQCAQWDEHGQRNQVRVSAASSVGSGRGKIGVGGPSSQLKQALLSHELLCIVLPHTSWSMGLHHIIGSGSWTAPKTAVCVLHGSWEAWKLLGRVDFW